MHDEASKELLRNLRRNLFFCLFFRRCEWTAFSFVFGYLFFFRTCAYYGFEKPPPHSNAIQLLITLRVIYSLYFLHTWYIYFPCGTIQIAVQGPQYNNLTFLPLNLTLCQILQVSLLFFFTFFPCLMCFKVDVETFC